jgi:hypothetical protein
VNHDEGAGSDGLPAPLSRFIAIVSHTCGVHMMLHEQHFLPMVDLRNTMWKGYQAFFVPHGVLPGVECTCGAPTYHGCIGNTIRN